MEKPLVSIILPTRNRLATIKRTVDRVLAQSFADWELIISDNASDEAGKKDYLEQLAAADGRIKVHFQPENIGIHRNWKFCIEEASGNYYIPVTDDDWWGEDLYLESLLALHDGRTGSVFPNMSMHFPESGVVNEKILTRVYEGVETRHELCRRLIEDRRGVIMVGLFDLSVVDKSEIIKVIDNDLASGIEVVGMNRIARDYDLKYCDSVTYNHTAYSGNHCNAYASDQVNQDRGIVGFRLLDDLRKASRADDGYTPAFLLQWEMTLDYCREMAGHPVYTSRNLEKVDSSREKLGKNREKTVALKRKVDSYETSASTLPGAVRLWWRLRGKRKKKG